MNDKELVRQIKQGNKSLFEELIRRYYDDIYRFCYYKTSNRDISYDLTQETFMKLIKYFNSYQEKSSFKSYLFSITINVCNNYYKQNSRKDKDIENIDESRFCNDKQIGSKLFVNELLEQLPDYQKDAIVLKYLYGFKIKEIARITNQKVPTVKSRLKQGLERMKNNVRGLDDERN